MNDDATVSGDASPRPKLRFGRSMTSIFAALAAALLTLALLIGQTIVAQREARTHAMNEGDTLLALNQLMMAVLDGETGQRGYLLTGKTEYLAPYLDAKQRRDRSMARLFELIARQRDPAFLAQMGRLDRVTDAKFAEMDRSVRLAQAGFKDQALALIQADFGKRQMDAIRRETADAVLAKANERRDAFAQALALERRLLPLIGLLGFAILVLVYAGFRSERRRSLAEAEAEQAAALREAKEQTELLARELNHRVKNLFSVILSIVSLSGRKQQASTREVVDDIRARIRALSLAHSASLGSYDVARVELGPVIAKTMEPYADEEGRRVRVSGHPIELPARMVTPIGLIIHELATNAVKYGALSQESGTVTIAWEAADGVLTLTWAEAGGPAVGLDRAATAGGFGSQMVTLAAGQLGGTIEHDWPEAGAVVRLKFPLP